MPSVSSTRAKMDARGGALRIGKKIASAESSAARRPSAFLTSGVGSPRAPQRRADPPQVGAGLGNHKPRCGELVNQRRVR